MPDSLVAVALLVALFLPGFLFQNGVKEYVSLLRPEREIQAVAQAVGLTAGFLTFVLFILSFSEQASKHFLHDPTSGDDPGLTVGQAAVLLFLLLFSNLIGKGVGCLLSRRREARVTKSASTHDIENEPVTQCQKAPDKEEQRQAAVRILGEKLASALKPLLKFFGAVLGIFFRPGPIDLCIDRVIVEARSGPRYVRLIRQGQDDIIGWMDPEAAKVSASALGSGLALRHSWTYDAEGAWQAAGPTHVGRSDIIEILTWPDPAGNRRTPS